MGAASLNVNYALNSVSSMSLAKRQPVLEVNMESIYSPALVWLGIALLLVVAEVASGTLFCLFLAAAFGFTALLTWLLPIGFPVQCIIATISGFVSVWAWKRRLTNDDSRDGVDVTSHPAAHFIGQSVTLPHAVKAEQLFRLQIGDSQWNAVADTNLEAGARVIICTIEGATLRVSLSAE